ncbi:MAG TPA: hypothetical protein VFB66_14215 [Tepidisphaeraceae bacterium]|nr:hypothetical protein [Tepidisphaeraceae bacterium]
MPRLTSSASPDPGPVRGAPAAAVLLMVAGGLAAAGCRHEAARAYDGPGLPSSRVARFDYFFAPASLPQAGVVSVDGAPVPGKFHSVEVLPGRRELEVRATWSNRWRDTTRLVVDARPGGEYAVHVRETKPPHTEAAEFFGKAMGRTAAGALLLPGMLAEELTRKPPTARPPRLCSMWITDRRTGKVVAGEGPRH